MEQINRYICDTQRSGIDEIPSQKGLILERSRAAMAEVKSKVKLSWHIQIDRSEIGWDHVDWIHQTRDSDK
jgi:hypothetical protein